MSSLHLVKCACVCVCVFGRCVCSCASFFPQVSKILEELRVQLHVFWWCGKLFGKYRHFLPLPHLFFNKYSTYASCLSWNKQVMFVDRSNPASRKKCLQVNNSKARREMMGIRVQIVLFYFLCAWIFPQIFPHGSNRFFFLMARRSCLLTKWLCSFFF